jgi:hypothetical protein
VPCAHCPKVFVALEGRPHIATHMMSLPGWAVRQPVQHTQLLSFSHARYASQQLVLAHMTQASSPAPTVQPPIPDELDVLLLDVLAPGVHCCAQGPLFCAQAPKLFVAPEGLPHIPKHMASLPGLAVRHPVQHTQLLSFWHATKASQQLVLAHLTHASSAGSAVQPPIPDEVDELVDVDELVLGPDDVVLGPDDVALVLLVVPVAVLVPPVPVAVLVPPVPVAVLVPVPVPVPVPVVALPAAPAPPLPKWRVPLPPQPPASAAAPAITAPAHPPIQAFLIAEALQAARRTGSSRRPRPRSGVHRQARSRRRGA